MNAEKQPMEYPEAKSRCLALAEEAEKLAAHGEVGHPTDAKAVRSLVAYADEQEETIKMLSSQVADYRTIIRRLTS